MWAGAMRPASCWRHCVTSNTAATTGAGIATLLPHGGLGIAKAVGRIDELAAG